MLSHEQYLMRQFPVPASVNHGGKTTTFYNTSAHFLWIGNRTRRSPRLIQLSREDHQAPCADERNLLWRDGQPRLQLYVLCRAIRYPATEDIRGSEQSPGQIRRMERGWIISSTYE